MSPENFIYWLQGFLEISNNSNLSISPEQVQVIKDHIKLVLKKETPEYQPLNIPQVEPYNPYKGTGPLTAPYNPFVNPFNPNDLIVTCSAGSIQNDTAYCSNVQE